MGQQRQPVVVGLLERVHRPGPGPCVQQQLLQLAQHLQPAFPLTLALRQQQHGARGGRHRQLGGRHLRAGTQAGGQRAKSQPSFLQGLMLISTGLGLPGAVLGAVLQQVISQVGWSDKHGDDSSRAVGPVPSEGKDGAS